MLQLPEKEKSLWRDAYPSEPIFPKLTTQLKTDVVVVGAGIAGLTTAYELMQAGKRVIVLEKDTIGAGTTGRTTGKVTSQHGMSYAKLWKQTGKTAAQQYAKLNHNAVKRIKDIIKTEKIRCDWQSDESYVFTTDEKQLNTLKHEAEIAADLGLPAKFVTDTPLPFTIKGAVRFTDQGKLHAQKYLNALARRIDKHPDCHVFEQSRAIGFRDGDRCRVTTMKGAVEAKHVVVATHVPTSPLLARAGYALLEYPTESYAVAGRLERPLIGMYKSPDNNHFSVQPIDIGGEPMILIVGAGGNIPGFGGNTRKRYERLAEYAEKRFGVSELTHHWSDMDYMAYDDLPLVGKLYPWSKHIYTATGFKKWGLSMGTAAAGILRDIIIRKNNPAIHTFRTSRGRAVEAIPKTVLSHITKS